MCPALDHVVITCSDLSSLGHDRPWMGFEVMPRMEHEGLGSSNRIIVLNHSYIEFLADVDRTPESLRRRLSPHLALGDGLAMVALGSKDVGATVCSLRTLGLEPTAPLGVKRTVQQKSGERVETDSPSSYLWREDNPYLTLFFCEHRKPEAIWLKEFQGHRNTAQRIVSVIVAAHDPRQEAAYFSQVLGTEPRNVAAGAYEFAVGHGNRIEILSASAAVLRGLNGDVLRGDTPSRAVALGIAVSDLQVCGEALRESGVAFENVDESLVVPAAAGGGVVWQFVEDRDDA